MTTGPRSQCSVCVNFRSPFDSPEPRSGPFCIAFPDGIPDRVFTNQLDHRQPIEGDHGIRWASDGHEYPEYALP